MGSEGAAGGQGAMSDIVRHWQEQVAMAEDRAAATAAGHAEDLAMTRDEHARCVWPRAFSEHLQEQHPCICAVCKSSTHTRC